MDRSKIARLLRRFRLFLCRPPCRINQAPTRVSPFGTARFTYVQRYATSVLLWGWGEGAAQRNKRNRLRSRAIFDLWFGSPSHGVPKGGTPVGAWLILRGPPPPNPTGGRTWRISVRR